MHAVITPSLSSPCSVFQISLSFRSWYYCSHRPGHCYSTMPCPHRTSAVHLTVTPRMLNFARRRSNQRLGSLILNTIHSTCKIPIVVNKRLLRLIYCFHGIFFHLYANVACILFDKEASDSGDLPVLPLWIPLQTPVSCTIHLASWSNWCLCTRCNPLYKLLHNRINGVLEKCAARFLLSVGLH